MLIMGLFWILVFCHVADRCLASDVGLNSLYALHSSDESCVEFWARLSIQAEQLSQVSHLPGEPPLIKQSVRHLLGTEKTKAD